MPSQFATDFNEFAVPILMSELGVVATYTPRTGSPTTPRVIAYAASHFLPDRTEEEMHWPMRRIGVALDPDGEFGGVAEPAEGDTITLDDGIWTVEGFDSVTETMATLRCALQATDRYLRQSATYWAPSGRDGYGGRTYAAPTSVACHWRESSRMFQDKNGEQKVSRAVVFLASDIEVDGYLYLGSTSTADPIAVAGAYEIKRFDKVPLISASKFLRTAYL